MISANILNEISVTVIKLSDEVIAQELDGEMVLLDIRNGEYFGINSTGSQIWQDISRGVTLIDIAASLSESFKLEREMAAADVASFVRRLAEMGLVEIVEDHD